MKNEHIVFAYASLETGGQVVIIGLTPIGIDYLKATYGQTLIVNPPDKSFKDVRQVIVYAAESKEALKELLKKSGVTISEVN
jgi:hypothetical protein